MPGAAVVEELRQLAEMRHRDPSAALQRAQQVLERSPNEPRVQAMAEYVLGLALHELGEPSDALAHYRRAAEVARRHGLDDCEGLARASMAISLLTLGDVAGARRAIAAAREVAPAEVRGTVDLLSGLVLQRTGRLDEALRTYRRALPSLRRTHDLTAIARLRLNRGILHAYRGDLDAALEDFGAVESTSTQLDLPVLAAMAAHNTVFAHGRRGNLPEALAAFDRAERAYAALGRPARPIALLEVDRCEVLLVAGLAAEARAAAQAAIAALAPTGDLAHLSEARLLLARAFLAEGSYAAAVAEAEEADRQFRRSGRPAWAALAEYVAIQAEVMASEDEDVPPARLLERTRRIAAELDRRGWLVEAVHVRTFAGRIALALGRPDVARAELAQAAAARSRGTADLRARAWHATALLRLAEGNQAGAKRALVRGMAVVEEYRATLGATELRVQAAGHVADLARLGCRLALRDGDAAAVLAWAERWRAGTLRRPAVRPPEDDQLTVELAELRRLHAELASAALEGRPPTGLRARIAVLERTVRSRTLKGRDDSAGSTGRIDCRALRVALGERVLVEYVALEGRLHAVTVTRREVRLFHLGPADTVEQERRYLLFALRRLMAAASRPRGRAAAEEAMGEAAARLDQLLFAPLRLSSPTPLVVVPTGLLHGLPWGALATVAAHPTTIAPSAALWLDGRGRRRPPGASGRRPRRVALVAGPGLPGCASEVDELARLYPDADVATGTRATAARVMTAIEGADLVHLAAHGSFRADSPLFSSLLLADGPVTVYDLERLRSAPDTFVLPACDAATAEVRTGDELLGTAAALLGLGVRCVVAPVMPVPDDATANLMVALHRQLRAGAPPPLALAAAAERSRALGEPLDTVTAAAFVCIACDDPP